MKGTIADAVHEALTETAENTSALGAAASDDVEMRKHPSLDPSLSGITRAISDLSNRFTIIV